jgi:hypothetical protein
MRRRINILLINSKLHSYIKKIFSKATIPLFCIAFAYIIVAKLINLGFRHNSDLPYYTYLLKAFLAGKVNVLSPNTYDLALFKGNWYLYWGPAPLLIIYPFFLLLGANSSDVIYTLIAGITNCIIFYFLIKEVQNYFRLRLSAFSKNIVLLSFAFCSPNFYLSLAGRIWHTNQIIAVLYLLIFLLFYFKFLNTKNVYFLIISVIFLGLSWLSRTPLIFYIPLYSLLPFLKYGKQKTMRLIKLFSIILLINLFLLIGYFAYNFVRFENIFETGLQYQVRLNKFNLALAHNKFFSLDYLTHNLYYYYLNPPSFLPKYPFIKIDGEGNSVLLTYPLLLSLFLLFRKKWRNFQEKIFFSLAGVIFLLNQIFLMLYVSTGASQLGNRYFFDVIPLLFILVLFVIEHLPNSVKVALLFAGFVINILGTFAFYSGYNIL